jgi:hypothetical protein
VTGGSVPRARWLQGVGRLPGQLYSTQFGQGAKQLRLDLTSLVGGDGLRATEAGYPSGNEGACHSLGSDVRDGSCFWPARETVDRGEAVCVAC